MSNKALKCKKPTLVSLPVPASPSTITELLAAIAYLSKNPSVTLLKTVIHQKQIVADSPGQSATVWDLSGKEAKDSAAEYENLFREILELLP